MPMVMVVIIMMHSIIERKGLLAVRHVSYNLSLLLIVASSLGSLLLLPAASAKATGKPTANTNNTQLMLNLKELDPCVLSSTVSFFRPQSLVPTNPNELGTFCQTHNEAYKCVREKSKGSPLIIRRGLISLVNSMNRMSKKYCADPNSQMSRKFVADLKCVVDKHAQQYRDTEIQFGNSFYEIQRQNYKDPVQELKYICCSLYKYRRSFLEEAPGCPGSRATLEEIITNVVANSVTILCDDEQHAIDTVCPNLAPLKLAKTPDAGGKDLSASGLALLLIATLGD